MGVYVGIVDLTDIGGCRSSIVDTRIVREVLMTGRLIDGDINLIVVNNRRLRFLFGCRGFDDFFCRCGYDSAFFITTCF